MDLEHEHFLRPYLQPPISLHFFRTGRAPLWQSGALDSQPRLHAASVKVNRLAVLSVGSRGLPLVPAAQSFFLLVCDRREAQLSVIKPFLQTEFITEKFKTSLRWFNFFYFPSQTLNSIIHPGLQNFQLFCSFPPPCFIICWSSLARVRVEEANKQEDRMK